MDDADDRPARGRPPHVPTPESRARVAELVALDADIVTIAAEIGIAEPTLRLHYPEELAKSPQMGFGFVEDDLGLAPERGKNGGRPPHVPTDSTRRRVEILSAAGQYPWQIAAALGISEPTLKLHYPREIMFGPSKKKAEMIEAVFDAGMSGKVAAQKAFIELCQENGADPLGGRQPAPDPAPAPAPKLGKKAQEMADAQHPDGDTTLGALMRERLGMPDDKLN